ncbi:MAG: glycosyltransferase family 2 protein [Bacteroidales bacterium]|nr:glycosyltransferase family 2 protein [Bacteroidales bacterium]
MKPNPFISIITVVYNSDKYLEKTILSIAKQNSTIVEYIIIDGGSKDDTINIIQKHKQHIQKSISEPDNGLYDAMNKGLEMASGEYVWFINSGDKIYDTSTVESIAKIAQSQNFPDVIYGETIIIDENEQEIGPRRLKVPKNLSWKSLIDGLVICHQSFIVKRNIAPKYNLKYKIAADYDWILKCLKNSKNVYNSKLILSRYLDNGFSKNNIPKALSERFVIMIKNYGFIRTTLNHILISFRFFSFLIRNKRF